MAEERPSLDELKKLKVVELKARLSSLGLQTSGLKADLVARLDSYFESAVNLQPAQIQESEHTEDEVDHGYDNKTENNTDTVEDDVSEVSGLEYDLDTRSDSEIVTIEGDVMEVSVAECEVDDRSDNETESDYENELEIVEEDKENANDNEIENVQDENEVDTVPCCEVENQTDSVVENGVISTEGNVTEVTVEPSVLESIATAVKQNNTTSSPKKRRRRPAGEISGRQRGLKRLKKEQQAGIDEEECDVIFAKKNWPPPFEESVIAMRSSLMQFTKKTEGWTKDDMAELRAYYKRKWKVEKGYESILNHYFKVAALSSRCFVAARQMMDNHKKKFAHGKSLWRQVVRPGLFDCLRKLCPIEDEESIYKVLKSYAEGKVEQGIRTAPTYEYPPTRNYKRKGPKVHEALVEDKFKTKYDQLKLDYEKLKKDKEKLARINAQLVKTISSLTELLQDRSLVHISETASSKELQNEEVLVQESSSLVDETESDGI